MKFTTVTLACLATGAYAHLIVERDDVQTIIDVINTSGTDIDGLDTAVKGFSGDLKDVQAAAQQLLTDLGSGKTKVDAYQGTLAIEQAALLSPPVSGLTTKGNALAADLHKQKDAIQKANLCDVTRKIVTDINTSSTALINAVISKVKDETVKGVAQSLADPLLKTLKGAQDDFSEDNCKNSGSSDSSSTGSASAPASTGGSGSSPTSTDGASAPTSTGGSGSGSSTGGASAPASTGGAGSPTTVATAPSKPTGTGSPSKPTSTTGAVVTAGAALIAPAGALAMAVAAIML